MSRGGLLIWNDCAPEALADYERWYQEEHLPERAGIPGYRCGARYEALDLEADSQRFFTLYETASPEVFASPAYLTRLANPTPWTQRVMPAFSRMNRTVCRQVAREGLSVGGALVTVGGASAEALAPLARDCLGWSLWQAAGATGPVTPEMALRGGADATVAAALLLSFARPEEARAAAARLAGQETVGCYRLLSVMTAEEAGA
ncbi:MAG: hypothetical protein Kilf2KO_02560 [Rhodospirillales bacterium]